MEYHGNPPLFCIVCGGKKFHFLGSGPSTSLDEPWRFIWACLTCGQEHITTCLPSEDKKKEE